jgi:integrase
MVNEIVAAGRSPATAEKALTLRGAVTGARADWGRPTTSGPPPRAWMGHSTIKVTFDRYGHLFPQELEDLAASLSDLRRAPDRWGSPRTAVADVVPIVKNS